MASIFRINVRTPDGQLVEGTLKTNRTVTEKHVAGEEDGTITAVIVFDDGTTLTEVVAPNLPAECTVNRPFHYDAATHEITLLKN